MDNCAEFYSKFPVILQNKLRSGEVKFPLNIKFKYSPILAYRAVERKKEDMSEVSREDFRSYFELGKKARGVSENDSGLFAVSLFKDRKMVEQKMKFPNPNKKMIEGYVKEEGGPQETNIDTGHINWWLYEEVDISGFRLAKA